MPQPNAWDQMKKKVSEAFDPASARADRHEAVFQPEPSGQASSLASAPNLGSKLSPEEADAIFQEHIRQQEALARQSGI